MGNFMCFYSLHHTVPHVCHHHITAIYIYIYIYIDTHTYNLMTCSFVLSGKLPKIMMRCFKIWPFLICNGCYETSYILLLFIHKNQQTNISTNQPTKKLICTRIYVYDKVFMGWWAAGLTICSWVDSYTHSGEAHCLHL